MRRIALPLVAALAIGACGSRDPYVVQLSVGARIADLADDDARDDAVDFLASLGPAVVPVLRVAIEREPATVRTALVDVIEHVAPQPTDLLVKLAHDPEADVRYEAVHALGRSERTDVARPQVEAALDDPSGKVRVAAATACSGLCTSPVACGRLVSMALSEQPPESAVYPVRALRTAVSLGPDVGAIVRSAADAAKRQLEQGDRVIDRARAAWVLAVVDVPVPVAAALAAGARDTSVPPLVRAHLTWTLAQRATPDDVEPLVALLEDPVTQAWAVHGLRQLSAKGVDAATQALSRHTGPPLPGFVAPPPGA